MIASRLILALALGAATASALAVTPKEQLSADNKAAADRYNADKKLCAEEKDSATRMQCLRDAKEVETKAEAAAKQRFADATKGLCADCGKVTSVVQSEQKGKSNAAGMIIGGVAGAVLGHQVGGGTGRDVATVAGAAGGAYAGKKVQENMNTKKIWTVHVDYDNGNKSSFTFDHDPGFVNGDRVKNDGKSIKRM